MATSVDDFGAESDFFIPLAPGETRDDRLAEIRASKASRHTVDPAHADMRGYIWDYAPADSNPRYSQEHRFRIIGANGREYMAVDADASAVFNGMTCGVGGMVAFSANNRGIVLETHAAISPDTAKVVDYDLLKRAWIAEDKANGLRFNFTTQPGGSYVHTFNGTPSLGATVSYHADRYGTPYGVMVQKVPRPVVAWRSAAFQAKRAGFIPLLLLSAGLQAVGAERLSQALLGGNEPVKALPPVKFPPMP